MTPTPEDLARDLRDDLGALHLLKQISVASAPVVTLIAIAEGAPRRAIAAETEAGRLRGMVSGLTDRVAAQSDLLTRRAEQ